MKPKTHALTTLPSPLSKQGSKQNPFFLHTSRNQQPKLKTHLKENSFSFLPYGAACINTGLQTTTSISPSPLPQHHSKKKPPATSHSSTKTHRRPPAVPTSTSITHLQIQHHQPPIHSPFQSPKQILSLQLSTTTRTIRPTFTVQQHINSSPFSLFLIFIVSHRRQLCGYTSSSSLSLSSSSP